MDENNETQNIFKKNLLNNSIFKNNTTCDSLGLDSFLENEKKTSEGEPWSKLNKTIKIDKINEYIDVLINDNNLSEPETLNVKTFIINCLDRKKLQCVKDVIYDKITGKIKSIPSLSFNEGTRKFTLKRSEKRDSTLKSLGPGKNIKTRKKTNTSPSHILNKKTKTTTITTKTNKVAGAEE